MKRPSPLREPSAIPLGLLALGLLVLGLLVLAPFSATAQDAGAGFKVIIHGDNPLDSMSAKELSKVFLKKTKQWPIEQKLRIEAYDLDDDADAREAFTRAIHGKSVSAIQSYWQRKIFTGKDVPLDEVDSDAEMMEKVAAEPGAVGYVSASTQLISGIKELSVTD